MNEVAGQVKVERIVIKIGDKEHEFSMEEAKELQKLLNNLLGEKETIYIPYSQPVVYPPTYQPYRHIPYPYSPTTSPWIVTCETNSTNTNVPIIACTYNGTPMNY